MALINIFVVVIVLVFISNVYGFSSNTLLQTKKLNRNKNNRVLSMLNVNNIDVNFVSKYSVLLSKIESSKTVPGYHHHHHRHYHYYYYQVYSSKK